MKKEIKFLVDEEMYKIAKEMYENTGMDIDTAVNVFIYQSVYRSQMPMDVDFFPNGFMDYSFMDEDEEFENYLKEKKQNKRNKS